MTVVCRFDELADGSARGFEVDGVPVAVVRIGDDVYAIGDVCSHAHVLLSEGEVWCDEREIECPQAQQHVQPDHRRARPRCPATQPVKVHRASVVDGSIVVELAHELGEQHSVEGVRP